MRHLLLVVFVFAIFSCNKKPVSIGNISGTQVGEFATEELRTYLEQMYSGMEFVHTAESNADVQYMLSEQAKGLGFNELPEADESFLITRKEGKVYIISPDERGLLNATYALLEKLGCGFYISNDVVPAKSKWPGFDGWEMADTPTTGDRFVFNWHNFLSGCTGWNLEDWQKWIDQSNKMRYNGVMVHAYGNNPMFTFEYLGEKKQTGYLNNTASGRDWGNQHVNDVRRLVGGEIFNGPVFGAEASMASEETKEKEATELMQKVFQYAEDRGTEVIFALDFDTWMALPQNVVKKLPEEAVFEIDGNITPNPEHPEGYKYFRHVLKSLLEQYPQIDNLSVWHRRPGVKWGFGTIWMKFPYEKFPEHWKKEYRQKLEMHPELEDNLTATSMFAYSKVVIALQKARDEIKPELIISEGSWRFDYLPYADAFYPTDVPILPLDWLIVFDTDESKEILASAGENRDVYPILWAHHDDHRYIGRPYTPWDNLSDRLKETNSKGFGIIHWTTHPLDLYFTSSARQVWQSTENESLETTVENYVKTNFGAEKEKLSAYFYNWLTKGPMFGRETSDHFVNLKGNNLGHKRESWSEMKLKAEKRLGMLREIQLENDYLSYQQAMEDFYISFFENQDKFLEAYRLTGDGKIDEAVAIVKSTDPDEAIQKYTDATQIIGFTPGEKAIVFTMNTRWKADYINLRQRLGLEPVRYKFAPTQHDPLAQAPGHYSYFVDEEKNWWRCLWEQELPGALFRTEGQQSFLAVHENFEFPVASMHGQALSAGEYLIDFETSTEDGLQIEILENGKSIASGKGKSLKFKSKGNKLECKLKSPGAKLSRFTIRKTD